MIVMTIEPVISRGGVMHRKYTTALPLIFQSEEIIGRQVLRCAEKSISHQMPLYHTLVIHLTVRSLLVWAKK
jgi:hypothetical protein